MTVAPQFPGEQSEEGAFVRQGDAFRDWVTADGRSGYPAEAGRYHLYVSLACPWAHRTIIVRRLKGLEDAIGMTVVDPIRDEMGWAFRDVPGASPRDPVNGFRYLAEAYRATDPHYHGRVTVPVLWDTQTKRIVSNSDDDIMRMFETEFEALAKHPELDLYPRALRDEIDALNGRVYDALNNGVYKAGFATAQEPYEEAARGVFAMLDELDARLATRRYLFGGAPVETDWRTLRDADPLRCGLRRPFQVQPAPNRRLPEPVRLPARPLPNRRRRRDGELRSHQAPLLHDARRDQPHPHRPDRATSGSRRPAPPRSHVARRRSATAVDGRAEAPAERRPRTARRVAGAAAANPPPVERFVWRVVVPLVFCLCVVLTIGAAFDRSRLLAPEGFTTDNVAADLPDSTRVVSVVPGSGAATRGHPRGRPRSLRKSFARTAYARKCR